MRSSLILLGVLGLFGLTGCMNANAVSVNTFPSKSPTKVFKMAQIAVSERMRDPESTRFKSEFMAYDLSNGNKVVCGTVNAKNAMGGYVGYQPFYVRLLSSGTVMRFYLSSQTGSFEYKLITNMCNNVRTGTVKIS